MTGSAGQLPVEDFAGALRFRRVAQHEAALSRLLVATRRRDHRVREIEAHSTRSLLRKERHMLSSSAAKVQDRAVWCLR